MRDLIASWRPTLAGKTFTKTPDWELTLAGSTYRGHIAGRTIAGPILDVREARLTPGTFWATLILPISAGTQARLDGLPNSRARELRLAIDQAVAGERKRLAISSAQEILWGLRPELLGWAAGVENLFAREMASRGWLSSEFVAEMDKHRPIEISNALGTPFVREQVGLDDVHVKNALETWDLDFRQHAERLNKRQLESELEASSHFFSTIEKSPLTREQIEAVVTLDSRVLLVASADSGKTSTMIARAGYAIHKGYFNPARILMLAFNNAAAAELRSRLDARLEKLELPSEDVSAKTFHAFGLEVIGQATGKRPSVAPWLESGQEQENLMQLVDDLKDRQPGFREAWDMFRVVFGQDLPDFGKEEEGKDSWDRNTRKKGFWTLHGETVKSRGELVIANWLFYNGVDFVYEQPYEIGTADQSHRQYNPDFFIPAINAYLEHWALDEEGRPPPSFLGYVESMAWKRELHRTHGTTLLETTMAQLRTGEAFRYLERELTQRGVRLDPNPDRQGEGRRPIESPRLARTFRTFMVHAKSNRLSIDELRHRLHQRSLGPFLFRHKMFLDLYEQLAITWERQLREGGYIDFEDMLRIAGDLIDEGRWSSPYDLVMVDEFQDASQARAQILKGLMKKPRACLFAVGDDWQSINRFAGSDLSAMTQFEATFGSAVALKLEETFRCSHRSARLAATLFKQILRSFARSFDLLKPMCNRLSV